MGCLLVACQRPSLMTTSYGTGAMLSTYFSNRSVRGQDDTRRCAATGAYNTTAASPPAQSTPPQQPSTPTDPTQSQSPNKSPPGYTTTSQGHNGSKSPERTRCHSPAPDESTHTTPPHEHGHPAEHSDTTRTLDASPPPQTATTHRSAPATSHAQSQPPETLPAQAQQPPTHTADFAHSQQDRFANGPAPQLAERKCRDWR